MFFGRFLLLFLLFYCTQVYVVIDNATLPVVYKRLISFTFISNVTMCVFSMNLYQEGPHQRNG